MTLATRLIRHDPDVPKTMDFIRREAILTLHN